MIDSRHIQDDFGNSIPMLDAYGNLSVQVIMLYAEDKLTESDRKAVDDFAATDEMSRDALDGYALQPQTTKTRMVLGNLNTEIQNATGSAPLQIQMQSKAPFNYRRLAAVITLLIAVGGGTFWASRFFSGDELAENVSLVNLGDSAVSKKEVQSAVIEAESGLEEAEEIEPTREKADMSNEFSNENDTQSKPIGNSETTGVKSLEKIPTSTGTVVTDNKRRETSKAPSPAQKDVRSEDMATKTKVGSVDDGIAQEQSRMAATDQSAGQRNSEKKAKDTVTKEAESRASAGRMREESAKAEMQSDKYDSAYEPTGTPAVVQQASNGSELSAKFPGGDVAMYKFIEKKKSYSDALRAQKVSGTISVWFDIETDGRVTNARIKSGEDGILTEDALRVVRAMPKWNAAQNSDGQAIKSSRTVVIKYGQE